MKAWFTSLNGAVTLSVIALLTFVARAAGIDAMLLDMTKDQAIEVALLMLWTMTLLGVWIWALLAAVRGRRGGVLAALIFSLLSALLSGLALLVFCAGKGCAAWPVGNIIIWAELITGLAASIALGLQLRQAPQ